MLMSALKSSWSAETSYSSDEYEESNPARGQCVVSSLVVQDYLGGELARAKVCGDGIDEKHYFNTLPDGLVIDTTRSQYTKPVTMADSPVDFKLDGFESVRERLLADDDTRRRYELLKQKVQAKLKENI